MNKEHKKVFIVKKWTCTMIYKGLLFMYKVFLCNFATEI